MSLRPTLIVIGLCGLCYLLGRSQAQTKYITQQVEVIKNVEKQKAVIYSRPHADRAALLKLMRENKL